MAVKIVRQVNQIAVIGAPTSAAGRAAGVERAPSALRAAGLVDRLRAAGYEVTDHGDFPASLYQPDEASPRARNIRAVVTALEALKPHVEQAFRSGALPLILGGDCTIALATLAGVRRYLAHVGLLYFDRDADLNTPETTPSGCLDGMGVAHIVGRGAPELVRFWSEPPLVREPDVALFGLDRLDPPEEAFLGRSPMRRYRASDIRRQGAATAAQAALVGLRAASREFVLHVDVDVISSEDLAAVDLPGQGGLRREEVRQALEVCVSQAHLAALEIAAYNPEADSDGHGAQLLVDLLVSVLTTRRLALTKAPSAVAAAEAPATAAPPESPVHPPAEPAAESPVHPPAEPAAAETPAVPPAESAPATDPAGASADAEQPPAGGGTVAEDSSEAEPGSEPASRGDAPDPGQQGSSETEASGPDLPPKAP